MRSRLFSNALSVPKKLLGFPSRSARVCWALLTPFLSVKHAKTLVQELRNIVHLDEKLHGHMSGKAFVNKVAEGVHRLVDKHALHMKPKYLTTLGRMAYALSTFDSEHAFADTRQSYVRACAHMSCLSRVRAYVCTYVRTYLPDYTRTFIHTYVPSQIPFQFLRANLRVSEVSRAPLPECVSLDVSLHRLAPSST